MENNLKRVKNYFLNIFIILTFIASIIVIGICVYGDIFTKFGTIAYIYIGAIILGMICLIGVWKSKIWGVYGILTIKILHCFFSIATNFSTKQLMRDAITIVIILWFTKDIWYTDDEI
ncbi:hypothetical protein [Clostridium rectalis]|uniref:hypothetical protein n=1 Tax=Clostridium rectalis TaxID=2040295 RepID=UPI000F63B992|nr:hypothetical protein [Clostridium rectalis]